MKKSLLLLVSAMLATVGAMAQTKPTVNYTAFSDAIASEVYLYNVEAGLFLTNGNYWGTRAAVVNNGQGGQFNNAAWSELGYTAEAVGTKWMFNEESSCTVDGTDYECYSISNISRGKDYLTADDWNDAGECTGIWVDGSGDRYNNKGRGWFISDQGDNTFKMGFILSTTDATDPENPIITYTKSAGFYGATYLASNDDTNTYIAAGPYTTWAIVTADEYDRVQPLLNLYYSQVKLAALIASAQAQGSTADLAGYQDLVTDASAERADVIAAIQTLAPAIELGDAIAAAKAVDPDRDYSKFEALYADPEAVPADQTAATTLLKALTALKQAIIDAQEFDAGHDYAPQLAIYTSDESTLDQVNAAKDLVNAFVALKKNLDAAMEDYPAENFSAVQAVYNNSNATAAEVAAAEDKIKEIKTLADLRAATPENPADISEAIKYITDLNAIAAGNGTVPKNGWTSTKKEGNFHINTWSGEGNSDGSNMTTPFVEYWKGAGNILDAQKFYRDENKDPFGLTLPAGAYRVSSHIRLFNEADGATYVKGAYFYANNNRISLTKEGVEDESNAIEGANYGLFNNHLLYWKDSFEVYGIVPEDGAPFEFGIQTTKDVNFNWIAAKGWKVEYLGASDAALAMVKANSPLNAPEVSAETVANKEMRNSYISAKAVYDNATSATEIMAAAKTLTPLIETLPANIDAYAAYQEELTKVRNKIDVTDWAEGNVTYEKLSEYLADGNVEGPGGENNFTNGSAAYILANLALSTEEITAETEALAEMLQKAIKDNIKEPGTDCTDMLVNAAFSDGFTGWTTNHQNVYKATDGGMNNVEVYEQAVDIYQIVKNVPEGIYSLTCNAFERTTWPDATNADDPALVYLFMNDFRTPVMNIKKDAVSEADAVSGPGEGANCYISHNGGATLPPNWPCDSYFTQDEVTYYFPNSMQGASYAFQANRYAQKVYGLIEKDDNSDYGTMKIGLTSDGEKGAAGHWVLWANFRLTFEGKTPEAIQAVLTKFMDDAQEYIGNNEDYMSQAMVDDLGNAILAAMDADPGDADALWNALININKKMTEARENVTAVAALTAAAEELDGTVTDYYDLANEDAQNDYDQLISEDGDLPDGDLDAYLHNEDKPATTADVIALTKKIQGISAALKIPAFDEEPTWDEPADMTECIVNAAFDAGNAEPWVVTVGCQNGGYQGASYSGPASISNFIETWRNGAVLDDGRIYQIIKALPAGAYSIECDAIASWQNDASKTVEGVTLFAQEGDGEYKGVALHTGNGAPEHFIHYFEKYAKETDLTVGIEVKSTSANWVAADNFVLTYYGDPEQEEFVEAVDIDDVEIEAPAIEAIYTITGTPVNELQPGVNFVKYSNGNVIKIFKK